MTREEAVARIKDHIEIHRYHERTAVKIFEALDMAIKALEQPERKTGKWINNSPVTMKCDQCGYVIKDWRWNELNFCANCGADMRMRGEQDG